MREHLRSRSQVDPERGCILVWSWLPGQEDRQGERFNTHALAAAHRSLPFGTRVQVTNERTGRSVVVRINDRGPFVGGRVIDLSKAAAQAVGISGVGKVKLTRL